MEISTEIIVNASQEHVWGVLVDFESYDQWNPFIKSIEGILEPGGRLKIRTELPNGKAFQFQPTLLTVSAPHELKWEGRLGIKGLFDGTHVFQLIAVSAEQTRVKHSETFRGLLVPLLRKMLLAQTSQSFHNMNVALKKRAEE